MKILTVVGTRPELVRLSRIIPKLDLICEHILVHTGQNFVKSLKDIFFEELGIRTPNYSFSIQKDAGFGMQISDILLNVEWVLQKEKPDKVLILGDTNSGLSAIIAEKMGKPTHHLEAGNRCFDNEVPEEINRKIIDHISTYNFPYTPGSRENLINEGINKNKIIVSGNPIYEVLNYYSSNIELSQILNKLNLKSKNYFLATFHRQECVDNPDRLQQIIKGLYLIADTHKLPIIVSVHPRTRDKLNKYGTLDNDCVKFLDPLGFFDFVKLEKNALCMISDSGTCCEEGTILRTPTVICRNTTERPETIEVGSAILSGISDINISHCVDIMIKQNCQWDMPIGYIDNNVSNKIIKFLLGRI